MERYTGKKNTDWELVLIGNGNLKDSIKGCENIKILNWLQPEDLHEEIKKVAVLLFRVIGSLGQ